MMSMAMTHQPGWVEQTARQMDGVVKVRRAELIDITAKVYADWLRENRMETISADLRQVDAEVDQPQESIEREPERLRSPSRERTANRP